MLLLPPLLGLQALLLYLKLMKTYVDGAVQLQARAPHMIVVNRENQKLCHSFPGYFGLKENPVLSTGSVVIVIVHIYFCWFLNWYNF